MVFEIFFLQILPTTDDTTEDSSLKYFILKQTLNTKTYNFNGVFLVSRS